ncbi:hypothetical protein FKM82_029484 [Ascaphus truei]
MCIPNVKWESNHKPRYLKLVTGVRVVLALVLIRSSVAGSFKNLVLVPNTIFTILSVFKNSLFWEIQFSSLKKSD